MRAYKPAEEIERAMLRYGETAAAVGGSHPGATVSIPHLRESARSAYRGYQAARYEDTGRMPPALIRDAETAARAPGGGSPAACEARAMVYDTAAALPHRVGEHALAWAAADRAMTAAAVLERSLRSVPEQLSVYGALHLAAVNAAASVYDRATVTALLGKAARSPPRPVTGTISGPRSGRSTSRCKRCRRRSNSAMPRPPWRPANLSTPTRCPPGAPRAARRCGSAWPAPTPCPGPWHGGRSFQQPCPRHSWPMGTVQDAGVRLATSWYSNDRGERQQITGRDTFRQTPANIQAAIWREIPLRAGLIDGILPGQHTAEGEEPLRASGVANIGTDHLREFGRGTLPDPTQPCGHCGHGRAAILPDGTVAPCPMTRWLKAGNVHSAGPVTPWRP